MNDIYNIRLIQKEELQGLLDLYRHLDNGDPVLEDSVTLQKLWHSIYLDPNLYYIVAEKESLLVSTCTISIIKNLTRNMRPYGLIENVVTHSEYRNQGLGKKVLKKAVEIAKKNNCYKVMLLTGSKKQETLNFYKSAGFKDDLKTGFIIKL
ncbi:L-amino acid N-acyltransferase YncA [Natranaerovirga hydrolytica]|uniref:L-amino acid N-acyltransferase YncA n=1 Tax=Natranaerovirga hydrolytica TaxID=680378 RepID=A0A4R1MXV2_9FIRM|nr:GNAT family N-acetyltransferase [Natranaerovirga hydrolytica]TCK98036.1 L-amino acid N-acyltransferase YncA [Natranaerovirga hydrolytica]